MIVLALPGAVVGALASALITERFKAGYQKELEGVRAAYLGEIEGVRAAHQTVIEGVKGEHLREIERLKSELARVLAKETEALKSQLAIASFEHQTRFSRLHERQVNVIAKLYRRLTNAEVAFKRA